MRILPEIVVFAILFLLLIILITRKYEQNGNRFKKYSKSLCRLVILRASCCCTCKCLFLYGPIYHGAFKLEPIYILCKIFLNILSKYFLSQCVFFHLPIQRRYLLHRKGHSQYPTLKIPCQDCSRLHLAQSGTIIIIIVHHILAINATTYLSPPLMLWSMLWNQLKVS